MDASARRCCTFSRAAVQVVAVEPPQHSVVGVQRVLGLDDVAPGDRENGVVLVPLAGQHEHEVHRAGDALGAADRVHEVGGLGLAGVMHDQQRRAGHGVGERLELGADLVVDEVGVFAGPLVPLDLAEGVEDDQRLLVGVAGA